MNFFIVIITTVATPTSKATQYGHCSLMMILLQRNGFFKNWTTKKFFWDNDDVFTKEIIAKFSKLGEIIPISAENMIHIDILLDRMDAVFFEDQLISQEINITNLKDFKQLKYETRNFRKS